MFTKLHKMFLFYMLFCALSCPGVACYAYGSTPDLAALISKADAICVAKVTNIQSMNRIKIEIVHKGKNGTPVTMDAQNAVADIVVESVLKGDIRTSSLKVIFLENISPGPNSAPFTELVQGENEMLFLSATSDKGTFTLTEPASHGRSAISFGTASLPLPPSGLNPLRAVLMTLTKTSSAPGRNKAIVINCLQRLQSIAYILYVKPGVYDDELGVATRLALGEPVLTDQSAASSLEQFIKAQIVPSIINLTAASDTDTSEQAFITVGRLQDPAVVTNLGRIAVKNYVPGELGFAAETIGEYRNPDAVVPLIHVLKSSSADVRQQASFSLGQLHNPLAIPFLVERLDDANPNVVSAASEALFEITDQPGSVLPPGDADSLPAREIAFWKKWAAAHQDKIKALRAQFNASAPVPSAP